MSAPVGGVWALGKADYQPTNFASTETGLQAALDYCEGLGGGSVFVSAGSNITVSSPIRIPNRVRLVGNSEGATSPSLQAASGVALSSIVTNKDHDGTQEYCWIEKFHVKGTTTGGATQTYGILFRGVYVNSSIRDCVVTSITGDGIFLDGPDASTAHGPIYVENTWSLNNSGHNIVVSGPGGCDVFQNIVSERPGTGKSCLRIVNVGGSTSFGHVVNGLYMETSDATAVGLDLSGVAGVSAVNIKSNGSGIASVVKITAASAGSSGLFGSSGHTFHNIYGGGSTVLVDDQVSGVTVSATQSPCCQVYICPLQVGTGGSTQYGGQVIGLQMQRQAVDIASASTIDFDGGNFATVTGSTSIDNISNAARYKGKKITMLTTSALTIKHLSGGTGNIRCFGALDYRTENNGTAEFVSDGTNWHQTGGVPLATNRIIGTVADGDTTPSVLGASIKVFGNTAPTTVTDFDDGIEGQVLYLVFTDANTTLTDSTLKLSAGFTSTANDTMVLLRRSSAWHELCRSVN